MLWQHLFWIFGHPEVYIMALPAFGMISEVLPVFSRKPLFGYPMMAYSIILIAFLSYGVWGHHMFATGMGPVADSAFAITSMLIAIPTGVKVFSWIATVWGGRLRFTTSMLFALGFILEFTIGGLSGVMHASAPIDLEQTDTYFIVAHFHYVLFGGVLMAILVGLLFLLSQRSCGRFMNETLGKWHFWLTTIGSLTAPFSRCISWANGGCRGASTPTRRIWAGISGTSSKASAHSALVHHSCCSSPISRGVGSTASVRAPIRGMRARSNGRYLRLPRSTTSSTVPTVHSRDAFWVEKYGDVEASGLAEKRVNVEYQTLPTPEEIAAIHMPSPSLFPIIMAGAIFLAGVGMLVGWFRLVFLGLGLLGFCAISMSFEYKEWGEDNPHQVHESFLEAGQSQSRRVVVHRIGMRILRQSDFDLHGLQVAQHRAGPTPTF